MRRSSSSSASSESSASSSEIPASPLSLQRSQAYGMAHVGLFAALMAVLGWIPKIDLAMGLPVTAQSMGAMLAGCLLGGRRGWQAVALFMLAVALGLPLLAGGRGGVSVFMATPGTGYLLGYVMGAGATGWLMGWAVRATGARTPTQVALCALLASVVGGIGVLHACGVWGLVWWAQLTPWQAVLADLVFVPGDLLKAGLCALVVHAVARAMPDWRFGAAEGG